MAGHRERQLFIPIKETTEVVQVSEEDLPADVADLVDVLKGEEAPLALYLEYARAYLALGQEAQFERLLLNTREPEFRQHFYGAGRYDGVEFDAISICCALAALYMRHGQAALAAADEQQAGGRFDAAHALLMEAAELDGNEQLVQLGFGQLQMARGNISAAVKLFERAARLKSGGNACIAALVAWGHALVQRGETAAALSRYRQALRECPGCPAEVRLGMAACFHRLGQAASARRALQRVHQLDPLNADALYGLAVLQLEAARAGTDKLGFAEGLQLACQAYSAEPDNAAVLNLLSHYSLVRQEYDKAQALASSALAADPPPLVRAQSVLCLGRVAHARGALQEAFKRYAEARHLDPSLPVARLGMAQALLAAKQHVNAISELEAAVEQTSHWVDALEVLSNLYHHFPSTLAETLPRYRAAAVKTKRPEVYEMLAGLQASSDPPGALKSYLKTMELYGQQAHALANGTAAGGAAPDPVPMRCRNNAAVLAFHCGKASLAQELFKPLAQVGQFSPAAETTLAFNWARILEACGELQEARSTYEVLLEQCEQYVDCHLRLSAIAAARGDRREARAWLEKGLELGGRGRHADLHCALAQLLVVQGDPEEANEVIKQCLAEHPSDAFALLVKAQLALQMAQFYIRKHAMKGGDKAASRSDPKAEETRTKIRAYLAKAMEAYARLLSQDEGNIYAANGVAAVLAEQAHFEAAQDILTTATDLVDIGNTLLGEVQEAVLAREGVLQMPDVAVNLAHTHLARRQFPAAIQLLTTLLQKHYRNDPATMLYLARVLYDAGRNNDAKKILLKAVHLAPTQQELRFNSAVTMQKDAELVFSKQRATTDPTKLDDFQTAHAELLCALKLFMQLQVVIGRDRRNASIDVKKLDYHIRYIRGIMENGQRLLAEAHQEQEMREVKRRQAHAQMEALKRRQQVSEMMRAEQKRQEQIKQERHLEEQRLKLGRINQALKDEELAKAAVKSGDAAAADKARKRQKADEAVDALFAVGDSGDEEDYKSGDEPEYNSEEERRRLEGTGLASSGDEDLAAAAEGAPEDSSAAARLREARDKAKKRRRKQGAEGGEEGGSASRKKKKKRLKRQEQEAGEADAGASPAEDAATDAAEATPSKRSNVLDSDDEVAGEAAAVETLPDDDVAAAAPAGSPPEATAGADLAADLFGDDESD